MEDNVLKKLQKELEIDDFYGIEELHAINNCISTDFRELEQEIRECQFLIEPNIKKDIILNFLDTKSSFVRINFEILKCSSIKLTNKCLILNISCSLDCKYNNTKKRIKLDKIRSIEIIDFDDLDVSILLIEIKELP